jgi:glycosyltransferase involved in cell wall biosynthesis
MKVAIVTAFPEDPDAPRGGVEAVSVNLVGALAGFTDLEIHVVTVDPACQAVTQSCWRGVAVHRLPLLGGHMLTGAIGPGRRQMGEYVRRLGPDVVHAHDIYGLMVKGLPIPRIFTIHGFIHSDTLVSGERWAWLRSRIWRRVETAGWADQPHIISISPYVRERLTGITTGVIHDIDNPVAESFFGVERAERKGTIFSAALISPRKNTLVLVDALDHLVARGFDVKLRLAGEIVEPSYGRLVGERIRKCGLEQRVMVLGRITSDQVRRELATASVFALVSLEENSPMGIEEAMAAGVPVVAANRCGMPYLVREGKSGFLVDPRDPEDVATCLGRLLEDDDLRGTMSQKAREIARDRFHPDVVAWSTREVYLRAMHGPPGLGPQPKPAVIV